MSGIKGPSGWDCGELCIWKVLKAWRDSAYISLIPRPSRPLLSHGLTFNTYLHSICSNYTSKVTVVTEKVKCMHTSVTWCTTGHWLTKTNFLNYQYPAHRTKLSSLHLQKFISQCSLPCYRLHIVSLDLYIMYLTKTQTITQHNTKQHNAALSTYSRQTYVLH